MSSPKEQLVGASSPLSHPFSTTDDKVQRPLGEHPLRALLYTEAGYLGAQLIQLASIPARGQARAQSPFSATWKPGGRGFTNVPKLVFPASVGSVALRIPGDVAAQPAIRKAKSR